MVFQRLFFCPKALTLQTTTLSYIFFAELLQNPILLPYFAEFLILMIVITKARGIRPDESLATLYLKEGATFYQVQTWTDNHEKFSHFYGNIYFFRMYAEFISVANPAVRCIFSLNLSEFKTLKGLKKRMPLPSGLGNRFHNNKRLNVCLSSETRQPTTYN